MDMVLAAFQRAHRAEKIRSIDEAFGTLTNMPSHELAAQVAGWECHLLSRALLVLRLRGVPEPGSTPEALFGNMVKALQSCQEIVHDDPGHPGRGKPAA